MHDDPRLPALLRLPEPFVFSMTMLVLPAGKFPAALRLLEAVGLCSYLLIGFW